jgi:hypothetical protein
MMLTDLEWGALADAVALAKAHWQGEVEDRYDELSRAADQRMRALDGAFARIRKEAGR